MYVTFIGDRRWLLNEQRKLYARSRENPDYVFRKLWGLVTDPRNLRVALARVNRNRGRRTAGVDRVTVRMVLAGGVKAFIDGLRKEWSQRSKTGPKPTIEGGPPRWHVGERWGCRRIDAPGRGPRSYTLA